MEAKITNFICENKNGKLILFQNNTAHNAFGYRLPILTGWIGDKLLVTESITFNESYTIVGKQYFEFNTITKEVTNKKQVKNWEDLIRKRDKQIIGK